MAGKARRVASRQAQLGRRRKRQQKGPGGGSLPEAAPTNADGDQTTDAGLQAPEPAAAAPVPAPTLTPAPASPSPAVRIPSPTFAQVRGERPPAEKYIGAELKRILAIAGSVLATIIVLGIVL